MSAARRQRLIRAREIQHRIATAASMTAEQKQLHLDGISSRIHGLRQGLSTGHGIVSALDLVVMGELAMRLERAQTSLVPHRQAAQQAADAARAHTMFAALAAKRISRLDERRSSEEERQRDLRAMTLTRRPRSA